MSNLSHSCYAVWFLFSSLNSFKLYLWKYWIIHDSLLPCRDYDCHHSVNDSIYGQLQTSSTPKSQTIPLDVSKFELNHITDTIEYNRWSNTNHTLRYTIHVRSCHLWLCLQYHIKKSLQTRVNHNIDLCVDGRRGTWI